MGAGGAALLERTDELERVVAHLAEAKGGTGSVVVLEGPPGIGKTSVLRAVVQEAANQGLTVLSARAGRLEPDLPWNLVRQLFADVITADDTARSDALEGAARLAVPALGLGAPDRQRGDEAAALHGLYWLTTGLTARGNSLVLTVDDAHWGDSASLHYLSYLAERVEDLPVLVLLTFRPWDERPERVQDVSFGPRVERIGLNPLSVAASSTLTRTVLGDGAADEFCSACHAVTGGNPFLLNELLGQLRRDGTDPSAARAAEVARVTPQTVSHAVLMRLSTLPPAAHRMAGAVALLGDGVSLFDAARVAELDPADAAQAADGLTAADILAAGTPLRFVHPLVREAVYGELPARQRAMRHGAAARILAELKRDPRRVAVQLLRCEPLGDAWVVERLREAAGAALAEGAPEPAIEFLRRALAEPPAPELEVELLRELARAEALSGSEVAMTHLERALAGTLDSETYAAVAVELVLLRFRRGDMVPAVELARELIEGDVIKDRVLAMRVIAAGVTGSILVPPLRHQTRFFLSRIPDDIDDATPEGRLALSARLADACGRRATMAEVGDLAERTLAGETLLRELTAHELLYWNATSALTVADRFPAARQAIDAALDESLQQGSMVGFALSSCFRCILNHRVGNISAGTADGWQAMAAAPRDVPQIRAYSAAFLVECLIERGDLSEALDVVSAPEFTGDTRDLFGYHLMRVSRAWARIARGELEPGVEELLVVGEAMGDDDFGPAMCPWRARAAIGLTMLGRQAGARALAEEELANARSTESGWGQVAALQALAAVTPEAAQALLEEAVELSQRHGFGLERARSLVLLGAHQRRRGQRRAAAELLEQGLEAAASCGGLALEERARSELVAIGLSPRRRSTSTCDTLTPAERRVAELAARGMSNRQIAQSLFVSLRTVETHLTRSYQKLGIASREELEPALARSSSVRTPG